MKKAVFFIIPFLLLLNIWGCQKEKFPVPEGDKGGTMVIATTEMPTSLNPLNPPTDVKSAILDKLFLRLHTRDKDGNIIPLLAASWEYGEDLSTITYYLRKGVKWSDGKEVTAEDIKFTFDKMKDPKTNYPFSSSIQYIEKCEVIDPYTVKFYFSQVYPKALFDSNIQAVPKHALENETNTALSDFNQNPITNGPYKVNKWTNNYIELTINENYYFPRPLLDKIVLWKALSWDAILAEMEKGNVDLAYDVPPAISEKATKLENMKEYEYEGNRYLYIGWNLKSKKFKLLDIRKALSMAINRNKIIDNYFYGKAAIATGPLVPSFWAYDPSIEVDPYAPKEALTLLKKNGYSKRKPLKFSLIVDKNDKLMVSIANDIKKQLSKIGVKVTVKKQSAGKMIAALKKGKFDAYLFSATVSEEFNPLLMWSSKPDVGKFNFIGYSNPEIDNVVESAITTLQKEEALNYWKKFQDIIVKDHPFAFLVVPKDVVLASKKINGIFENANTYALLKHLDWYWIPSSQQTEISVAKLGKAYEEKIGKEKAAKLAQQQKATPTAAEILQAEARKTVVPATKPKKEPQKEVVKEEKPKEEEKPTEPEKPAIITMPQLVSFEPPEYPEAARSVGAEGTIFLQLWVTKDGTVKEVKILRSFGNAACEDAAIKAVKKSKWSPATKDGVPFDTIAVLPVRFSQ